MQTQRQEGVELVGQHRRKEKLKGTTRHQQYWSKSQVFGIHPLLSRGQTPIAPKTRDHCMSTEDLESRQLRGGSSEKDVTHFYSITLNKICHRQEIQGGHGPTVLVPKRDSGKGKQGFHFITVCPLGTGPK